ncbi:transglutaminase-like cysteine peptidase [Pannonibacter phragmitetus]|uniref:transglutaminase-like cysteine peptidase n=1 Tax=Pannonibacter phragmitetus TaxID=121719 RepID=UPI001AD8F70A
MKIKIWKPIIACAAFAAAMYATAASANPGRYMAMAGAAAAPQGHLVFCKEHPAACAARTDKPVVVKLSEERFEELLSVNATVNREIRPVTDMEQFGVPEYWTFPDNGIGDCEEYVIEKQRRLLKAGWPASALLITVVKDINNEGHAVLTVRTDQGDLILDNQIEAVLPWYSTPYRYVKRQATTSAAAWTSISDTRVTTVASIGN